MPKALLIACSEQLIVEKDTELLSLLRLVEEVVFRSEDDQSKGQSAQPPLKIISTWMMEENDTLDDEFEFRFNLKLPKSGTEFPSPVTVFKFEGLFNRFILETSFPKITVEGIMWFMGQVRRKGEEEWITHMYPVMISKDKSKIDDLGKPVW